MAQHSLSNTFNQVTRNLPYGGGSYQSVAPLPGQPGFIGPIRPPVPLPGQPGFIGPIRPVTQTKTFTGGGTTTPAYNPPSADMINPATGKAWTITEEAQKIIADRGPVGSGTKDIYGNYLYNQFAGIDDTEEEAMTTAMNLGDIRRDIAAGEIDPYNATAGGTFSPVQLKAIRNAMAGIYDPALNSAVAHLDTLQKNKAREAESLLDHKNKLAQMAAQHEYTMKEKGSSGLEGPTSYKEWVLAGGEAGTGQTYAAFLKGGGEGSFKAEIATTGRQAISTMLTIGKASPGIFGRTAAMWLPTSARSDAFRNYSAQLETLKGNIIPAALTAMREASKTGGALGQVSDREGAWLAASLGAINMEQTPEQVIIQLGQIDKSLERWQDAMNQYEKNISSEESEMKALGYTDEQIAALKEQ